RAGHPTTGRHGGAPMNGTVTRRHPRRSNRCSSTVSRTVRRQSNRSARTLEGMSVDTGSVLGDVEISEIGTLLADRARCRVLMALNDGRALPASVLADEAGVARSTASSHLSKLTEAGLLNVETHGRHRYYRLAGPQVGELLERLTQIS